MKELQLSEIRKIQVAILRHFDSFCNQNQIRYFLCNGTLLGAVKYKGYIPWDDDIDVFLPRADYERFIRLYHAQNENSVYQLRAFELEQKYFLPFAKLMDTQTRLIEKNVADVGLGVNIDVFPIDNFGDTIDEAVKTYHRMKRLRRKLALAKLNDYSSTSFVKRMGKILLSTCHKIVGAEYYCKKIIGLAVGKDGETSYQGNCVWGFYGPGEAIAKELFDETVMVEFEGEFYPAPIGYDTYLRGLYGEYEKDPPKEKQVTHHSYRAYRK